MADGGGQTLPHGANPLRTVRHVVCLGECRGVVVAEPDRPGGGLTDNHP